MTAAAAAPQVRCVCGGGLSSLSLILPAFLLSTGERAAGDAHESSHSSHSHMLDGRGERASALSARRRERRTGGRGGALIAWGGGWFGMALVHPTRHTGTHVCGMAAAEGVDEDEDDGIGCRVG